jgi:uncharacterized DUF497 family protein
MQILPDILAFVWDKGNQEKSKRSHRVEWWECEEAFFNFPLYLSPDIKHSSQEERYFAFGHTNANRLLMIVFTVREKKIRIISARDMNKRERKLYHEKNAEV